MGGFEADLYEHQHDRHFDQHTDSERRSETTINWAC